MKNFSMISIFFIGLLLVILGSDLFSGKKEDRIKNFNESVLLEKSKNYDKAIQKLTAIYEDNKDDYLINLRLGWLYYLNNQNNESANYYNNAVKISKNKSVEAYLGLTYPLANLGKWNKIEETYKNILNLDPNNYTANLRLGQILLNSKNYADARNYLEKVYQAYPSDYETNTSLSWTYYYLGKRNEAKTLFLDLLTMNQKDSLAILGFNLVK